MKISSTHTFRARRRNSIAFTFVETMISAWIFSIIVITAMVALQIFALRTYTLAATKLTATAGGRKAMDQIRDAIREGRVVNVGNCNNNPTTYTNIPSPLSQIGNSLIVYATTNTNNYVIFYLDSSTATNYLKQYNHLSNSTNTQTLASYITNQNIFAYENYATNVQTNANNAIENRQVIRVVMQFYQWEYPIAVISSNIAANAYDYYQLRTRVTRRAFTQ